MKKGFKLDPFNNKHRIALQKVIQKEAIRKIKEFCVKKSPGEQLDFIKKNIATCKRILDDIFNDRVDMRNKGDWKYCENSLIIKTQVICTTLSMAGIERLDLIKNSIDYLIVDEAC